MGDYRNGSHWPEGCPDRRNIRLPYSLLFRFGDKVRFSGTKLETDGF